MEELINLSSFGAYFAEAVNSFGAAIYLVLFAIVFLVTGIVLTPILPGNSLLFLSGTLAGGGLLNIWLLYFSLLSAAILGNIVNYHLGYKYGSKLFEGKRTSKFFKKEYLQKAHDFYAHHGGKAVIFARFLVILRTFAPFVAGIVKMPYRSFLIYNVIGAFIWVSSITFGGYFFGGIPLIRDNFEIAAIIIFVALYTFMLYKNIKNRK